MYVTVYQKYIKIVFLLYNILSINSEFYFFQQFFLICRNKIDIEKTTSGLGGIPADAIYTTPRTNHHQGGSPEAMKVRLAAMVIQPPTRV